MVTVGAIVAFLREIGETTADVASPLANEVVHGARSVDQAERGELSWLSPKYADTVSDRLGRFRGTLLLHPIVSEEPSPDSRGVPCRNPKLAFSRTVHRWLPHLMETEWVFPAASPPSAVAASSLHEGQLGKRVRIAPGVVLSTDTIVGDDVEIGPNSCVAHARIARGAKIGANCTIGQPGFGYEQDPDGRYVVFPHIGGVVIEENVEIGNNTCIDRGALGDTIIRRGAKIDNLVHIAHNAIIGNDAIVIAHAMIAGSVKLGDGVWVAPSASVLNQLDVGAGAVIGMGAVVIRNVDAGATVVGNPAKPLKR